MGCGGGPRSVVDLDDLEDAAERRVLLELLTVANPSVGERKAVVGIPDVSLLDREYAIEVSPPLDHPAF